MKLLITANNPKGRKKNPPVTVPNKDLFLIIFSLNPANNQVCFFTATK
ncbi:Uncharacterised protein [Chlamydia trachomatis]|nr:Uncharacterised protein [Chlamydia trachomatis]